MSDNESDILFVLNGLERSGTIWVTRLLADALGVAARTLYHDPPYAEADDPAVWHIERPGRFIRRLHSYVYNYPYEGVPVLLLVRDPRDVAVSRVETDKTRTEFSTEEYDAEALRLTPIWCDFCLRWKADARCKAVIRYEDVFRSPRFFIGAALGEMQLVWDAARLSAAVKEQEFSVMKNRLKGNHGEPGAWRKLLSFRATTTIFTQHADALKQFRYEMEGAC